MFKVGNDPETFFIQETPVEVKKMIQTIQEIKTSSEVQSNAFGKILRKCSQYLREPTSIDQVAFDRLVAETDLKPWTVSSLFAGTFLILQKIIRNRVKLEVAERDLRALSIPEPLAGSIIQEIQVWGGGPGLRASLSSPENSRRPQNLRLRRLRWRVDVTISTSAVSRVMRPTVLMQMILSDGSIKTFEVSPAQFHRLRHSVAKVLRHMQELERHPIMRIAAYAEKRSENT
mmetsp:Transcript_11446/g.14957  ORF Transcript_11446/g.14957 Transcript_11446/m.14957 type:complete len:231 (-) Transcript_11446:238-930(-)